MDKNFFIEATDKLNRILEASKAEAFRKWLKSPGPKTYKDYEAFVGAANTMAKPYWYKYMKAEGPAGAIRSRIPKAAPKSVVASATPAAPKKPTLVVPTTSAPAPIPAASPKKEEISAESIEKIKKILYSVYTPPRDPYNPDDERWQVDLSDPNWGVRPGMPKRPLQVSAYAFTGQRGPRIDHGGGSNGDDWMEDYKVDALRDSAAKKWKPTLDRIVHALEAAGYTVVYPEVDYGEKGHISLSLVIK